jgi:hypothetical protein
MLELAKEKRRMKQRKELKKMKIRADISREKLTAPWDDHPLKGTLHTLWTHGTIVPLTFIDIESIIYYGWRTVKSQINYIILKSIFKKYITVIDESNSGKPNTYFLDPSKRQIPFDILCDILEDSYYKTKFGPNKPEQLTMQYLREIEPHQWKHTGEVSKKNQYVGKYPDFSHKFEPYLIEFNGIYYHGQPGSIEERIRKKLFAENGKYTLFLSEYDLKDPIELKARVLRFRAYKKGLDSKKKIDQFLNMEF